MTAYANTEDFVSATTDYQVYIRPGKCSCWSYYCSNACRCVPKEFCFFNFEFTSEGDAIYFTETITWDEDTKCWLGPSGISLCLGTTDNGFTDGGAGETYTNACVVNLSDGGNGYYSSKGYDFTPETITARTCDYFDMSFTYGDTLYDSSGNAVSGVAVYVLPAFEDCSFRTECDDASPCQTGCDSHPQSITMDLYSYSISGIDECGEGGIDCTATDSVSITLNYYEEYFLIDGDGNDPPYIEIACGYRGFLPCGESTLEIEWFGGPDAVDAGINVNQQIEHGLDAEQWGASGITQTCNPYYASGSWNELAPTTFFFNCDGGSDYYHRFDMTITEN